MDPFRPAIDLSRPLRDVARRGFATVPAVLDDGFVRRLAAAVGNGAFAPVPPEMGPVRQETESLELERGDVAEADLLGRALTRRVREQGRGIRGLVTWRPNEITVQRYRPGAIGITPHLDGKRYRRLVALITLEGAARFSIHETREGPPVASWEARPGDLTLLRGPGLSGHRDGRPFHAIRGPRGRPRLSIGFRMRRSK